MHKLAKNTNHTLFLQQKVYRAEVPKLGIVASFRLGIQSASIAKPIIRPELNVSRGPQ